MAEQRIDDKTGTPTVGHEWDGIEELDTPMPRWWLWTLYATIVFAIGYVIAYPALPGLSGATPGVIGWTSHGELARELAAEQRRLGPTRNAIAATSMAGLLGKPRLLHAAQEGGRAAFKVHCVQCHGSGAAGSKGYPNLNDDDWLWGGDVDAIHTTLENGIRAPGNDATRMSQMPAFGRDGILQPGQIQDVVSYVRTLSTLEQASASSQNGAALFAQNCSVCHGDGGKGNRTVGAPNLSDRIWLYGSDRATLTTTIANARYGVMPAWGPRLDPVTVKMLAAYVHSLGGGEAAPAQVQTTAANVAANGAR
jgi:cytochrome c oxidase cbb3-type subunit 3